MLNWVTSKIRTEESVRSLVCFILVSPISLRLIWLGRSGIGAANAYLFGFSELLLPKQRPHKMLLNSFIGTEDYVYIHKPISFPLLLISSNLSLISDCRSPFLSPQLFFHLYPLSFSPSFTFFSSLHIPRWVRGVVWGVFFLCYREIRGIQS